MKSKIWLSPKYYQLFDRFLDFYYNWASSPSGFLRLILSIRFAVLLICVVNFGYIFREQDLPSVRLTTGGVLWFYLSFTLFLLSLAILKPDLFEGLKIQRWQVSIDTMVISYLYWVSAHALGQADPYIFLFYFLPLLVTSRFLGVKTLAFLMSYIITASIATWIFELNREEMHTFRYWFTDLLPQFGFLFILAIFYLIYYRRRRMGERLQMTSLAIEDQIGSLWQGWFSLDSSLRVTAADSAIRERHHLTQTASTCAQVFCAEELPGGLFCSSCPLGRVLNVREPITSTTVKFVDKNGAKYLAQIRAQPVLNTKQEITGVNVWVQDLDQRRILMERQRVLTEDLERVIDQNRRDDRAHVQRLAQRLDAVARASASALSSDLYGGADEIVRVMAVLLGCRLATVRQFQQDRETGREGLVLCNHFGIDPKDIDQISFLDLNSSSLVVKAFKTGEDQYIEDIQKSGFLKHEQFLNRYELHSLACFPLQTQGSVIGTLALFRNKRQGFSAEDLQLGRAIANIMAPLVANQQKINRDQLESQRRKRELDILSSLSQKLVTSDDPKSLARLIADTVRLELHAETAAVFLKTDGVLIRMAISGLGEDWFADEKYRIGQGITGRVALPGPYERLGMRMLDNAVEDSDLVLAENLVRYSQKLQSGTVRHLLAVPLNGLEGTFGVLRVVNKLDSRGQLDSRGFSEQEAELMTTLSCIVAVALENTRLFEAEKKKHLLEQALRQGTRNLTSTLDEGTILATILEQLRKVVRYDTASLFLREPDGLRLKSLAGFSHAEAEKLRDVCLDPDRNPPFQRMRANLQPILIDDLWEQPLLEPIVGTYRIRSWIGMPLMIREQIIGWLSVDSWTPDKFTREDVEVAQDFAQQAAIAIDHARQYQLEKEQVEFLMRLDQHLVDITSHTDKKVTMNKIAWAASQLMNCEIAGVALYDKLRREIRATPDAGYTGVPEEYARNFHFPLEHPGGRVLQEKRVYFSNDASSDSESIFGRRLIESIGAKGVIAAPLMIGEYIVGVLYAASPSTRNWTESEVALFSILSNHSAIAIRNSELFDAKERRAQLLDLLHHLSIAGQLTNDPQVIYNILLTAVTAEYGLRFNRALLLLYDREKNVLKGSTGIGQLERPDAYHIWETLDDKSHAFESYIEDVLSNGILRYTALHYKARNLEIPIQVESDEVLSRVFLGRKLEVVDPSNEHGKLAEDFYRIFDANPFVVVPLLFNNEVMGMLVVDNKMTGDPIHRTELELLESCASQAAAAIYRSNLYQQLRDRVHVLERLQELTRAFSELAEPREVLRRIAEATNDILRADISYLAPYDQDIDELLVEEAVTAGAQTDFKHMGTFSTHGLTAMAKQEPSGLLVIEDLKAQTELRSRFAEQEEVHSVAVCRLELHNGIVGMLYVNYRRPHWFSELELNTLLMLAGQAAVAINNARLSMQNENLATQRERNRLREDLHDVLNTYAFKVMEPAESIFERERASRKTDPARLEEAEELWRFSRHTYQQLERILDDMREPILVERGLSEALRTLIRSRLPGVEPVIRDEVRPSADVELVLYRICQEAISNIRKHANIPREKKGMVNIILELQADQSRLVVQDHGAGFSPEIMKDRKRGMGLQAMHNWARKIRAQINIRSNPGEGTYLEIVVPIAPKETEQ
jgi:GAF domain-containing protein